MQGGEPQQVSSTGEFNSCSSYNNSAKAAYLVKCDFHMDAIGQSPSVFVHLHRASTAADRPSY